MFPFVELLKTTIPHKSMVEKGMYSLLSARGRLIAWSEGAYIDSQKIAGSSKVNINEPFI